MIPSIIASVVASLLIVVSALNAPASLFSVQQWFGNQLGAFSTISTATNIADFPAIYNANLDQTVNSASTTLPALTTLANLSTVGTITTGTWNGTAIGVAYGGTGTTSPTSNQVIIGNGASGFKVIGFGTSGQFLTSQGAGSAPQWTTSSVNEAGTYNWTGLHTFLNASSTLHSFTGTAYFGGTATSTFSSTGALTIRGDYTLPLNDGTASSTVLSTNGSGSLSFNTIRSLAPRDSFIAATTTDTTVSNTVTETTYDATGTITIPANTIGTQGTIRIRATISDLDFVASATADNDFTLRFKLGGTTVCSMKPGLSTQTGSNLQGYADCELYANNSASAQFYQGTTMIIQNNGDGTTGATKSAVTDGTSTIDFTTSKTVTLTVQWDNANAGNTITISSLSVIAL